MACNLRYELSTGPTTVGAEAKICQMVTSDNGTYVDFLHFGKRERAKRMTKDDLEKMLMELLIKLFTALLTWLCTRLGAPNPLVA